MTADESEDLRRFDERTVAKDLRAELVKLPYTGSMLAPPDMSPDDELDDWVKSITDWVQAYGERAHVAAAMSAQMKTELDQFRAQRAAIRSFLGTD